MSVSDWSPTEDGRLLRMWCADEPPRSIREIADELDRSSSSVDRRITALGLRGHKGDRHYYEQTTGIALEPVIRPVRVELPAPPTFARTKSKSYTTLVWSDVHFPFHSENALSLLRQIAADAKPEVLMCLGDVFDFFELSDHRPPRDVEADLQETLELGVQHLADMRAITGAREAVFLAGNHEDRWERMLYQAERDVRFRQLLKIPKVKRALSFEEVVGFEELGYSYHPYTEGAPVVMHDTLVLAHGDRTNRHVSAAMLQKYGKNVMFGHMHRIQSFTKRDLKGQEAGWCIGCLCTLEPHYDVFADWHHGFAIINWHLIGGEWRFDVEQIRIHNNHAIWRNTLYTV